MKNKLLIVITAVILFLIPNVSFGQAAPPLGLTSTFALFTATGAFNNTGISHITGDIGSNSAAVVGFPPGIMVSGTIYTPLVAPLPQAAIDVAAAYAALTQVGGTVINVLLEANGTLTPGLYTTGAASSLNGNLTLNGAGIYVIRIGGALTVGNTAASSVTLIGGATWDNVYWQIGGAFHLGSAFVSSFSGTVVAAGAINLYTTSTLIGRGLTTAGAINVAANTVTLGSPPAAPTITPTQPTCTVATGTITVTAPIGAVTYSIGGAYQAGVIFSAVAPGTYSVTAKNNSDGLISPATSVTINAQPPTPAAPTVSATLQPTCSVAVGIIVVTAPVGAGMTYSIGGPYQGMTFSGVSPGSYTVTAKNSDGCISPGTNVTINAQPAVPVVIVSNNGPVCEGSLLSLTGGPSGMMTYAWTGPNLFSSISQSPVVSNNATPLMAGIYSLTVIDGSGCISLAATTTVIVNAKPAAPIAGNNGPVCEGSLLSLTGGPAGMTAYAWTGPNLFSSFSQSPTVSTNATAAMAGIYNLTVTDGNGCASLPATTEVRVNALSIATANNNGPVCEGSLLSLSGGPLGMMAYAWTGPNLFTGISQSPIVSNNATSSMAGIYSLTVIDGNGCTSIASTSVIVNATPAEPTVVLYQPTCNYLTTGTIIFMAPTGGGMTYSIGGAYQSGSTFREVAPGTYFVTAKSAAGCLSPGKNVTILAKETPALPTAAATLQPTCTVATGTITVTAPTGPGMTYSIGGAYQESAIFSGVAPGIYFVTAKNADGCVSPGMGTIVTINPLQATPAAPTAILTQPTCTLATGTITVTAPIGTGITYSIGGAYQSSAIFSGVTPGTYFVTVKSADGCISPATNVTINLQPAAPAAPTASALQPTCTVATGTITVTAPIGTGITYSIGGAYQTSVIFNAVATGTYIVTVKNADGCISPGTSVMINAQPASPAAPTVTSIQPTCILATGTIIVMAPTGTGITYSIGGAYQTSVIFSAVASGTYIVTAKNADGCVSPGTSVMINAQPATPAAPTAILTQPTCTVSTGTITVTAPTGTGITYSIGGAYQASAIFSAVTPGIYIVTAKSAAGCVSAPTAVSIVVLDCGADLSILNTVNNTYPLIGRSVVFTVVATNNGPNGGTGVTVNDMLLSGYTYVSSTVTKGTYVSSTGIWTIGTMNNGASETMTITAKVNPTGSYVSPATITGIELDRNLANNISTAITYPMDFFIPEGFSPDGDGINDLFVIRGINYFPDNEFVIYNRWGNKVYEASSYLNTWDGRSTRGLRVGGDELPTGTYFYMLDLGDGSKVIKGTIYLNR